MTYYIGLGEILEVPVVRLSGVRLVNLSVIPALSDHEMRVIR